MYTKGPWEWVDNKFRGGFSGITGADNAEVLFPAHCNDGDEGDAWFEELPTEADRNLIVVAPELLEACKNAHKLFSGCSCDGMHPRYEAKKEALEMLEKAIAKAEGRVLPYD